MIVRVENGVVVQRWNDVATVEDHEAKYGAMAGVLAADARPGQLYDGVAFNDPAVSPDPVTVDRVNLEAERRILEICPEWRQRNLTAQAAVLAEKGRANWSNDELAAWTAGEVLWGQILAIRAASNVLNTMTPIPADYEADTYWP